jgi:hypothetical protein
MGGGYYFFNNKVEDDENADGDSPITSTNAPLSKLEMSCGKNIDIICIQNGINLISDPDLKLLFNTWFIKRENENDDLLSSRIKFTEISLLKMFKHFKPIDIENIFKDKVQLDFLHSILMSSLVGWYNTRSFNSTDNKWYDISGQDNHAQTSGCKIDKNAVVGSTTSKIAFPLNILPPTFTLIHVSKYTGTLATSKRIFTGKTKDFYSGHNNGITGTAYHGTLISEPIETLQQMFEFDVHTSTNDKYFFNNTDLTSDTVDTTQTTSDQLIVNPTNGTENSDFAIALVLVYNTILTDDEIQNIVTGIRSIVPVAFKKTEGFTNSSIQKRSDLSLSELNKSQYSFI